MFWSEGVSALYAWFFLYFSRATEDISIAVKAVGSYLGYPRWDETADMDKNDFINIMSLGSVVDYGKTSA